MAAVISYQTFPSEFKNAGSTCAQQEYQHNTLQLRTVNYSCTDIINDLSLVIIIVTIHTLVSH